MYAFTEPQTCPLDPTSEATTNEIPNDVHYHYYTYLYVSLRKIFRGSEGGSHPFSGCYARDSRQSVWRSDIFIVNFPFSHVDGTMGGTASLRLHVLRSRN